jgi:tRNA(Ile)-lysidine synthase TilS/MesJ
MEEITINMFDHEKKNYTYTIMRPLLHQTKQSIVTWCDMVGLHYVVDETNFDRR